MSLFWLGTLEMRCPRPGSPAPSPPRASSLFLWPSTPPWSFSKDHASFVAAEPFANEHFCYPAQAVVLVGRADFVPETLADILVHWWDWGGSAASGIAYPEAAVYLFHAFDGI